MPSHIVTVRAYKGVLYSATFTKKGQLTRILFDETSPFLAVYIAFIISSIFPKR